MSKKAKVYWLGGAIALVIVLAIAVYNSTYRGFVEEEEPVAEFGTTDAATEEEETPAGVAEATNLAAIQAIADYQAGANETTSANLKERLAARRVILGKAIRQGKLSSVEKLLLPPDQLAAIPAELKGKVESTATLTGKLESIHLDLGKPDDSAGKEVKLEKTKYLRRLIVGGQEYKVFLPQVVDQPQIAPRFSDQAVVNLNGAVILGSDVLVKPENIIQTAGPLPTVAGAAVGVTKVAVVLVNFKGNPRQFIGVNVAREKMFGLTGDTIANWYMRQSFGKTKFEGVLNPVQGDVFGWYTIDHSPRNCSLPIITSKALAAVKADPRANFPGVEQYGVVIYAFPSNPGCGTMAGGAEYNRIYLNGNFDVRVAAHEFGHFYELEHAGFLKCTIWPTAGRCGSDSYGDPMDVMGHGKAAFQGSHQAELGYLVPANVQIVGRTGTFTLNPIEKQSAGLTFLRAPIDEKQSLQFLFNEIQEYHIEYRSESDQLVIRAETNPDIDAFPQVVEFLKVGKNFYDDDSKLRVTFLSELNDQAQVRVDIGDRTCIRQKPSITVSPVSQVGQKGQSLIFDLKVTNNHNRRCLLVDLNRFTVIAFQDPALAGWTAVVDGGPSLKLAPRESKTLKLTITAAANALAGYYKYEARISDDPFIDKAELFFVIP